VGGVGDVCEHIFQILCFIRNRRKNKVFTHHLSILGGGQEQRHGGFFGERAGFYHLNRLSSI
jgi:hypothetical protein